MALFDTIRMGASGAATGYEIERSLKMDGSDGYLTRTPTSTGNRKIWTWSGWVKRTKLDNNDYIFSCNSQSGNDGIAALYWKSGNNRLQFYFDTDGSNPYGDVNDRDYRDVTNWYHIVWQVDASNTTHRIWVNGVEETITGGQPPNYDYAMNRSGYAQAMGTQGWDGHSYRGHMYFAECHYSDGYKYEASDFGEINPDTGVWSPKKVAINYGTNGFYLNFSDNSNNTAATIGKDTSGNGNNWTPNGIGTGDAVKDTPTNNFCTLSAIYDAGKRFGSGTIGDGALKYTGGSSNRSIGSTFGIRYTDTQGYYFEARIISGNESNRLFVGIGLTSTNWINTDARGASDDSWVLRNGDGAFLNNGSSSNDNGATSVGDIIQIAVKGSKIWVGTNNSWHASGNPSAGTNEKYSNITSTWTPVADVMTSNVVQFNFGQDSSFSNTVTAQGNTDGNGNGDFYYAPPTGFLALCSKNLPDPTITLPNKHFGTLLWTGNATANRTISDTSIVDFTPDWVWVKCRSNTHDHQSTDSVRGTSKAIAVNTTGAEEDWDVLYSGANKGMGDYVNGGFILDDDGNNARYNQNSQTFVAWNWNGGDTDGKTYTVTVVSDSGNKYRFDGYGTSAVTLDLAEGGTYIFNYPSAHPLRFSTTADGTHGGGSEYTTGVTHNSSTQVTIVVAASAPTLYYYCSLHSGMGGQVNTNSTLGSSNFDGSIQSTVKANSSAGISIATWTSDGSGSPSSFGHGLGVAPEFLLIMNRSSSGNRQSWSNSFSNATNDFISLNLTTGKQTAGAAMWGTIDSSVVNFRHSANSSNGNGMVGYFFSSVDGFSKHGFYTSNGNSEGTFVFLGFRPALIIFKNTSQNEAWSMFDNQRDPDNPVETFLRPSGNNTDTSGSNDIEFLSNGFKLRTSNNPNVGSSSAYFYMAFAETPFKYARAR